MLGATLGKRPTLWASVEGWKSGISSPPIFSWICLVGMLWSQALGASDSSDSW